jgi:hypothetical protein
MTKRNILASVIALTIICPVIVGHAEEYGSIHKLAKGWVATFIPTDNNPDSLKVMVDLRHGEKACGCGLIHYITSYEIEASKVGTLQSFAVRHYDRRLVRLSGAQR